MLACLALLSLLSGFADADGVSCELLAHAVSADNRLTASSKVMRRDINDNNCEDQQGVAAM